MTRVYYNSISLSIVLLVLLSVCNNVSQAAGLTESGFLDQLSSMKKKYESFSIQHGTEHGGTPSVSLFIGYRPQAVTPHLRWTTFYPSVSDQSPLLEVLTPTVAPLLLSSQVADATKLVTSHWYDGTQAWTSNRLPIMSRNHRHLIHVNVTQLSQSYFYMAPDSLLWLHYDAVLMTGIQLFLVEGDTQTIRQTHRLLTEGFVNAKDRVITSGTTVTLRAGKSCPAMTGQLIINLDSERTLIPPLLFACLIGDIDSHVTGPDRYVKPEFTFTVDGIELFNQDILVDYPTWVNVQPNYELNDTIIIGRALLSDISRLWAVNATGHVSAVILPSENHSITQDTTHLLVYILLTLCIMIVLFRWDNGLRFTLGLFPIFLASRKSDEDIDDTLRRKQLHQLMISLAAAVVVVLMQLRWILSSHYDPTIELIDIGTFDEYMRNYTFLFWMYNSGMLVAMVIFMLVMLVMMNVRNKGGVVHGITKRKLLSYLEKAVVTPPPSPPSPEKKEDDTDIIIQKKPIEDIDGLRRRHMEQTKQGGEMYAHLREFVQIFWSKQTTPSSATEPKLPLPVLTALVRMPSHDASERRALDTLLISLGHLTLITRTLVVILFCATSNYVIGNLLMGVVFLVTHIYPMLLGIVTVGIRLRLPILQPWRKYLLPILPYLSIFILQTAADLILYTGYHLYPTLLVINNYYSTTLIICVTLFFPAMAVYLVSCSITTQLAKVK